MSEAHYARIADLYDTFVRTDYDTAFFISEGQKAGGAVLELMAGTGRLTVPLLQAGIPVTAVDFSEDMLAVLRTKLEQHRLQADVHRADIRQLALNRRFKQIIIPFQAFPELTTEADQRQALTRIHEHLAGGGEFICTLHNPAARLKSVDGLLHLVGKHPLEAGGELLVWLLQRRDGNIVEVLEFFEIYDAQGMMQSRRYSTLTFNLLEKETFERLIGETGFEAVDLYGDYHYGAFNADSSPFMIWRLRARG